MKTVNEILSDRRKKNEIELENRKAEIFAKVPEIKNIIEEIKTKNLQAIELSLEGKNINFLLEEISNLQKRRKKLMQDNDFSEDYLEIKYHCNICKDTGIDKTQNCICKRKLMIEKAYDNAGIADILKEQNFDNFDLNLFRKNRQDGEMISPYENMKIIREDLYNYSFNFCEGTFNLFIYGEVGTGKTYLLNCIAKEVLDLGYSVVYLMESDLVNDILEHRFAYSEDKGRLEKKVNSILNCDLLIIDDLGANNTNQTTISAIFEVINYRLVKKKPVIISSNLDTEDIRKNYDMRIYSRIMGEYHKKRLFGNDIRISLWKL